MTGVYGLALWRQVLVVLIVVATIAVVLTVLLAVVYALTRFIAWAARR